MGLISGFIDLASPPVCFACNCRSYDLICPSCDGMIEPIEDPVCRICGKPGMYERGLCPGCRENRPDFDRARALAVYDFPIREAVICMKRRSGRRLAEYLGFRMHEALFDDVEEADVITFVPIMPGRRAKRGYNQAQELAAVIAGLHDKPMAGTLRVARPPKDQGHLTLKERRENMEGAFTVRNNSRRLAEVIQGRSLILVDDVLTTGCTASACSRVLKDAGASRVTVLTLAHAGG